MSADVSTKPLMFDALQLEHYERRLDLLLRALSGIASCATQCGCCRLHQEIASEAIVRDTGLTGIQSTSAASASTDR